MSLRIERRRKRNIIRQKNRRRYHGKNLLDFLTNDCIDIIINFLGPSNLYYFVMTCKRVWEIVRFRKKKFFFPNYPDDEDYINFDWPLYSNPLCFFNGNHSQKMSIFPKLCLHCYSGNIANHRVVSCGCKEWIVLSGSKKEILNFIIYYRPKCNIAVEVGLAIVTCCFQGRYYISQFNYDLSKIRKKFMCGDMFVCQNCRKDHL